MFNDALTMLGDSRRVRDIVLCDPPKPPIKPSTKHCIYSRVLPSHPQLQYADLNRVAIPLKEARRRFYDGQPVYVNNKRYEKDE